MRKHSLDQLSAWAKDWGIRGYEHTDPVFREKHRQREIKKRHDRDRRDRELRYEQSKKR